MPSDHPPQLRLYLALGQLQHAADYLGEFAFSLDLNDLNTDEKALRDYCAKISMNLQDCLEHLRALATKRTF